MMHTQIRFIMQALIRNAMAQRKARNANSLYYPPGFATLSQANVLLTHSILIRMLKKVSPSFVALSGSSGLSGCLVQPNKRDTPKQREKPAPFPQSDWEPHDATPPCLHLRIDCQPPLWSPGLSIC